MKLEQNDLLPLFSSTSLPDIFFTEYLPEANGDYLKVYLYILFLSKYDKDIKLNDLSKKLNLSFKVIQDAMKYWEDQNVIVKKNTGYAFNNLQEIELNNLYKPRVALSAEQVQKSAESQKRAKTMEYINNRYFSGLMPTTWYPDIELWFKKYGFDDEVMMALFNHCFDKSALHKNYIQTVADAWAKNSIKTYSDLDLYFEKQEAVNKIANMVIKKLGLGRQLSQYEYAYVEKWIVDFKFNFDICSFITFSLSSFVVVSLSVILSFLLFVSKFDLLRSCTVFLLFFVFLSILLIFSFVSRVTSDKYFLAFSLLYSKVFISLS